MEVNCAEGWMKGNCGGLDGSKLQMTEWKETAEGWMEGNCGGLDVSKTADDSNRSCLWVAGCK